MKKQTRVLLLVVGLIMIASPVLTVASETHDLYTLETIDGQSVLRFGGVEVKLPDSWLHKLGSTTEDSTTHYFFGSGVSGDATEGYGFCNYWRVEVLPLLQEKSLDSLLEGMSKENAIVSDVKNIEFNGSPARIYDFKFKPRGSVTLIGKGINFFVDDGVVTIYVTAPSEDFDSYGVLRESLLEIDDIGYQHDMYTLETIDGQSVLSFGGVEIKFPDTWLHKVDETTDDSTCHLFYGSGVSGDVTEGLVQCAHFRIEVLPDMQESALDSALEGFSEANARMSDIKNIEFNGSPARIFDFKNPRGTGIGKGIAFMVDDGLVTILVAAPSEDFDAYGVLRESLLGIGDIDSPVLTVASEMHDMYTLETIREQRVLSFGGAEIKFPDTWLHQVGQTTEDSMIHFFYGSGIYGDITEGFAVCQYGRVEVLPGLQEFALDSMLESSFYEDEAIVSDVKNIEFNGSPARFYDFKYPSSSVTVIGKGITFLVDDGIVTIHVTAPSEDFDSYGVLRESLLGIDDIGYQHDLYTLETIDGQSILSFGGAEIKFPDTWLHECGVQVKVKQIPSMFMYQRSSV